MLQGLLVCKKCGYAYYGKPISLSAGKGKRRSYAYYRCTGTDAYRFGGQRVCDNKQVRTDLLEEAVWQDVRLLLTDPQRVEKEYKRRLTGKKKHVGWNTTEQLHALIKKVKRGMARLVDAYQDGLIDKIEFEPRMRKAKERLGKLQAEAKRQTDEQAQQRELRQVIGHMKEFTSNVKSNLKEADWMMRREIIRALVRQIEVGQQAVRVVYRVAPPPFVQAPEKGRLQYCLRCENSLSCQNSLDQSHQPTRSAQSRTQMPPKWPHFRDFAPTTFIQLNNPLSANSKKFLFHKCCIAKALQKAQKLVMFSMTYSLPFHMSASTCLRRRLRLKSGLYIKPMLPGRKAKNNGDWQTHFSARNKDRATGELSVRESLTFSLLCCFLSMLKPSNDREMAKDLLFLGGFPRVGNCA